MTTLLKLFTIALLTLSFQCDVGDYNTLNGEGTIVEKQFEINDFNQVSFGNGWDVKLIKSNENKLVAKANQNLIDELKIDQESQTLKIGTMSKDNIDRADSKMLTLYFNGDLSSIKTSSGVSLFSGEQLVFNDINISSSSGSRLELNVKTQKLSTSSSSGSNMKLKISSTIVEASSSSGSELNITGKSDSMSANSSSGSNLILEGFSEQLSVTSSSGSSISAKNQKAVNVTANASSGSSISVFPVEVLEAKSSSGASVRYHNKPTVKLDKNESSGGSVSSR